MRFQTTTNGFTFGWLALMATGILLLPAGCGRTVEESDAALGETGQEQVSDNRIELAVETQNQLGILWVPAELRILEKTLKLTGVVAPVAAKVAEVRSLTRGRLTAVDVTIGDRVRKDQVLARYDDIELGDLISQRAAAVAALEQAEIESGVASKALDRARTLVEVGALAEAERQRREAECEQIESRIRETRTGIGQIERKIRRLGAGADDRIDPASEVDLDRPLITPLVAPIGGVVTQAEAAKGEVIDSSDVLFEIADISVVWVQGNLHEKDIALVRPGALAAVSVIAFPSRQFQGRITYVGDLMDRSSRTLPVRCVVDNPQWELKLGMFAAVEIPLLDGPSVLAVPAAAIQSVDGKPTVFVRQSPTIFEVRTVSSGSEEGGWVEILDGLSEGEEVVSEGSFQLKSVLLRDSLAEED